MQNRKVKIKIVKEINNNMYNEGILYTSNFILVFDTPVQEFIDNDTIDDIIALTDSLLEECIERNDVFIKCVDEYNLPESLTYIMDDIEFDIGIEKGLLKDKMIENGCSIYDVVLYETTTINKTIKIISKNKCDVINIVNRNNSSIINDTLMDESIPSVEVDYEFGIDTVKESRN